MKAAYGIVPASDLEMSQARYELKFSAPAYKAEHLAQWIELNEWGFSKIYHGRWVNSIYYDNLDLDSYQENLSGASFRKKIRLRWYGNDYETKEVNFEQKIKRARLGWKKSQKIQLDTELASLTWEKLESVLNSELQPELRMDYINSDIPIISNRYFRNYYLSNDGMMRITLDRDISCFDLRQSSRPDQGIQLHFPDVAILEIKFAASNFNLVQKIVRSVQLAPSRFSKYASAVQNMLYT